MTRNRLLSFRGERWCGLLLIFLGLMLPLSAMGQTRTLSDDNSDSVAVIIGNKNYRYVKGFPVDYAINDANAIKDYVIRFLRFDERNIIFEQDATKAILVGCGPDN
jgi:hypothetical protein